MPVILKQDKHKFERKKDIISRSGVGYAVIPNKVLHKTTKSETDDEEAGDGLFSSLGTLAKSGIDLISRNKDSIANVAKGVAGVGSAAASIAEAVKSSNELEQLKRIEEMRNKALEREKRKLSESTKQRLADKLRSGTGFIKVD